jgi:hypothetical protein
VIRQVREFSQLDRLIREPARLTIMLILGGGADFLYLQREGGFTQGNLSGHSPNWRKPGMSRSRRSSRVRCRRRYAASPARAKRPSRSTRGACRECFNPQAQI